MVLIRRLAMSIATDRYDLAGGLVALAGVATSPGARRQETRARPRLCSAEATGKKHRAGEHIIDLGCCRFQFNHQQSKRPKAASGKRSAAKASKRTHAAPETSA